jgi:Tfp pilus assembly protein PilF
LGNALKDQGKAVEAEASYREALRLKPAIPEALCNLGIVLRHQGRFAESLAFYKRGHELRVVGAIRRRERLGGLLHYYYRQAA